MGDRFQIPVETSVYHALDLLFQVDQSVGHQSERKIVFLDILGLQPSRSEPLQKDVRVGCQRLIRAEEVGA